jgi:uncharacterized damage-inducible protein DinB
MLALLEGSFRGPSWHGPSVKEALKGVTAAMAAARPIARAHTIGELVLHMATWKRAVALRVSGVAWNPSDVENFPPFAGGEAAWKRARTRLASEHARLRAAVERLRAGRLDRPAVPGGSTCYVQIHGAISHDLWHAGQILILRRALEGAPTRPRRARSGDAGS